VCLFGGGVLFLLLRLIFKNWQKAAVITTFSLLLFFSYGHIYSWFKTIPAVAGILGHHSTLVIIYLLILASGVYLIVTRLRDLVAWTQIMNIITTFLLVSMLGQLIWGNISAPPKSNKPVSSNSSQLSIKAGQPLPDIYYIILDMYTRDDVLSRVYGYDNSSFINELENLGFVVARCSHSNYTTTELSLSSSLNMYFLDRFAKDYRPGGDGDKNLAGLLQEGYVRKDLAGLGYKSVAFETGYYWDQWMDADIYLVPKRNGFFLGQLRPFESLMLENSAAILLRDAALKLQQGAGNPLNFPYAEHIQREQFLLDKLPNLTGIAGPKLVFAHVLVPHFPFIFGPNGEILQDPGYYSHANQPINEDYFRRGYTGQVTYINKRILEDVRQILAQSKIPPVIIIQGDHGVSAPDRYAILNAYYLPGGAARQIYPSISPVNTFRIIFNSYFSANYKLLPDTSFKIDDSNGHWIEVPGTGCSQ
jgi:hypothetical protein